MIRFHEDMTQPVLPNSLFVFGSNLAGRHGSGSARAAYDHYGAAMGVFNGHTGDAYAIPTVDTAIQPLPIEVIGMYIDELHQFAKIYPNFNLFVTRLGCGIAGFTDEEVARQFANVSWTGNFDFPIEWKPFLGIPEQFVNQD